MLCSTSEVRLLQIDSCVNELLVQAQNVRHLLNICIQHEKVEKLTKGGIYQDNEIPDDLLHLPIMKSKVKKHICKYAKEQGIENTAYQYSIQPNLIQKWMFESELIGKIKDDKNNYENLSPILPSNLSRKRLSPDKPGIIPANIQASIDENWRVLAKEERPKDTNADDLIRKQRNVLGSNPENIKYPNTKGIASFLTGEEKARIAYDHVALGIATCERKWGLLRQNVRYFIKSKHLFGTDTEKEIWISKQGEIIARRKRKVDIKSIKSRVEGILAGEESNSNSNCNYYNSNYIGNNSQPITLNGLITLSFEKGIAMAAVKYKIGLFDLEFLLQFLCPNRWLEMELNEWFLEPPGRGEKQPEDEEVVNLALNEGYLYAGKKFRIRADLVRMHLCKHYQKEEMYSKMFGTGGDGGDLNANENTLDCEEFKIFPDCLGANALNANGILYLQIK